MAASAAGAAAPVTAPAGIAVLPSEIDSLLKSKFGKLVRAVYSSFSGRSDSDLYDDLVLCVTIYGSRLCGTDRPDSDWDIRIVIDSKKLPELVTSDETNKDKKDEESEVTNDAGNGDAIGSDNSMCDHGHPLIDLTVHTSGDFEMYLGLSDPGTGDPPDLSNQMFETIYTPTNCTVLGGEYLGAIRARVLEKFDDPDYVDRVRTSLSRKSHGAFSKATSKISKEIPKHARGAAEDHRAIYMISLKSIFHSIRILMHGVQIGQNKMITNFGCANHIWDEITKTLVPKIDTASPPTVDDIEGLYKKYAKTPYKMDGEKGAQQLETRFKMALPRKPRTRPQRRDR